MSWGPIDPEWGEGWEDFDVDPFADEPSGSSSRSGTTVARLPRTRRGRRGDDLDRSVTAPRPAAPRPAAPSPTGPSPTGPSPTGPPPTGPPPTVPPPTGPPPTWPAAAPRARRRPHRPDRALLAPRRGVTARRSRRSDGGGDRGTRPRGRSGGRGGGGGRRHVGTARPERRSLAFKAVLAVMLLAVVGKLVDVQVLAGDRFVSVGEEQRLRTVRLDAARGRILDRGGHDLALSVQRPSVFADPSQVDDPVRTARALAPVLGVDVLHLEAKLSRDSRFVHLARRVDDDLAGRVVELDLAGIHLLEEPARFTPSGDLARSVIGAVADDQTGSSGMELLLDDVLTGTPGELRYERARDGGTIAAAGQTRVPAVPGDDVILTLDRSLQYETERLLAAQVDELGAKGGMAIVSRPATGEIYALGNITRNTDGEIITAGANRAVIDVFEPGSVNKVITIAAALEEGLVEPDTELLVPDRHQVSDHVFSDDHEHATAPMTVTDILAKSSNVGTIMLGQQLGKDRIDRYLREFGFGEKTALDFPFESGGLLLPPERWSGTSIGSIPIGQGIAVTAMQMLSAYNVIANDGMYVAPRLVEATVDANGRRTEVRTTDRRRVVSEQTARRVRSMLVEAVVDGTGGRAQVPGYSVGGKTGTARKPQDTGTYQDLAGNYHYVAAFTGMVPVEDPQLSIIVVVDEPTATIYGGSAAAPVFADLAGFALNRFRIPPVGTTPMTPTDATAVAAAGD